MEATETQSSVPVVAIGSSAGGLEALRALLSSLADDTGLAIVVIQHAPIGHDSHLDRILATVTSMRVQMITDGVRVAPDGVYIVPPGFDAALAGECLHLSPRGEPAGNPLGIDFFFTSLAQNRASKAIGVVLSGAGSDGTVGLKAIKGEGGITIVQDPKTARFDGMPRSAIASGIADLILPPEAIAEELARLAKHPYTQAALLPHIADEITGESPPSTYSEDSPLIRKILEILLAQTRIDFSQYKMSTIRRRIERQMMLRKIETIEKYAEHLQKSPDEVKALYEDIFIHVTDFFRDPAAFEALRQIALPALTRGRDAEQPIRIWVPGCATGEEVYSLAILMTEHLEATSTQTPIHIFAGDISEPALVKARKGVYADYQMGNVSQARLDRFFERVKGGYKVKKLLRDACVFSRHDVTSNPPIPRADLISCRNVLIYFSTDLQKRVFPVLHYALNPGGFLWLGRAENPDGGAKLFKTVDKTHKIFAKVQGALPPQPRFSTTTYSTASADLPLRSEFLAKAAESVRSADQVILFRYAPPSVVVDASADILQFRGKTVPYLEPAPGIASYNLLKMIHPDLLGPVRTALQVVKQHGSQARKEGISFDVDGKTRKVNVDASVLNPMAPPRDRQYLIIFEDPAAQSAASRRPRSMPRQKGTVKADAVHVDALIQHNSQLLQELEASREYQQSLVEEYEAAQEELTSSNEELRSTNEELQSSNEELHSTNEELGTAKEELQATNEELSSTNEELQRRNDELEAALRDLERSEQRFRLILDNVRDHAIFMLDPDGHISTWSEGARNIEGYEETEILGHHFSRFYTAADVARGHPQEELRLAALHGKYEEEGWRVKKDGRSYWASVVITALRDATGNLRGFGKITRDLTERRNAELAREEERLQAARLAQVKQSEQTLSSVFDQSPTFMTLTVGPDHVFERANQRYYELLAVDPSIIGRRVRDVLPEIESQGFLAHLDHAFRTGEPYRAEEAPLELRRADGTERLLYVDFVYQPIRNADGEIYGLVHQGSDVTEKVLSRRAVENERENFRNLFKQTPEMVCILRGPDHVFDFVNEAHIRVLGFDATGKAVRVAQPESVEVHGILDDVYRTGKTAALHEIPVTVTDRLRYFNLTYAARRSQTGDIDGVMILGIEVTDQVLARRAIETYASDLQSSQRQVLAERERFQRVAASIKLGVWYCDLPFSDLIWNDEVKAHFWLPPDAHVTIDTFYARLHPDDVEPTRLAIETSIAAHELYDIVYRTIDPADPEHFHWIRAIGWTDYDSQGTPLHFDGITLDITATKRVELELAESEAKFRLLANAIPQITWTTDVRGRLTYLNERWSEYTGEPNAPISREAEVDRVHPDDRERVREVWSAALETGNAFSVEARLRAKSGEHQWFLVRGNPVRDDAGNVQGWFGTSTHIEEQKHSQEILTTLNTVGQQISGELDLGRLVQSVTDAATRLTGAEFGAFFYNVIDDNGEAYTLYTLSGVPREAFSRFPMPRNTQVFEPTFRGKGIVRSDDITRDPRYGKNPPHRGMPEGHLKVVSYLAAPVVSRSGEVLGGLFFGHPEAAVFTADAEEIIKGLASQAAIAIDNARLYQQTKDAVRLRDEFLSIASHELRTPLTGLKIQTQMFNRTLAKGGRDAMDPTRVRQLLIHLDGGLNRLVRLVDDMLDIARIQNGRLSLRREPIDLVALLTESLERLEPELAESGIALSLSAPEALTAELDRFRIEQVVTNLVTNAIRYAPGAPIDVSVQAEPSAAVILFRDHGPGISAANREKVFDRFERLISANHVSGMGLGLYISREIVEAHGGTIDVESEVGAGACFRIVLPVRAPEAGS